MKLNTAKRIIIVFFLCPLAFAAQPAEQAAKIDVTADNNGPGSSIAAAIASAAALHQKAGSVNLVLNPGVYSGRFMMPDWINLIGRDRDKCVIVYDRPMTDSNICREWGRYASTNLTLRIIIAADGSGAFSNVTAAIMAVGNANQLAPVDLMIKPGIYRETIKTRDWVNLIGMDRDKCVITDAGAAGTNNLAVVTATTGTRIQNLTLASDTAKHVVNSDRRGNYILSMENCILRRASPASEPKICAAALSVGLQGRQHICVTNCVIQSALPVHMHNWNDQHFQCSMTLEHCILNGNDYALEIVNLGSNAGRKHDYFAIHDCTLQGSIHYVNQKNVKGISHGASEIMVVGSGNTISKTEGLEIKKDDNHRLVPLKIISMPTNEVPPDWQDFL